MSQEIINVPPLAFKIIWPILYTGLLLFILLIQKEYPSKDRKIVIDLFWIGILLNILWCIVYFYYRKLIISIIILSSMIIIGGFVLYFCRPTKSSSKKLNVAFSIYTIYTLWLVFALVILITNNYYKN